MNKKLMYVLFTLIIIATTTIVVYNLYLVELDSKKEHLEKIDSYNTSIETLKAEILDYNYKNTILENKISTLVDKYETNNKVNNYYCERSSWSYVVKKIVSPAFNAKTFDVVLIKDELSEPYIMKVNLDYYNDIEIGNKYLFHFMGSINTSYYNITNYQEWTLNLLEVADILAEGNERPLKCSAVDY